MDTYVIITIIVCATVLIKAFFLLCYYSKCSVISVSLRDGIRIERKIEREPAIKMSDLNSNSSIMMTTLEQHQDLNV